MSKKLDFISEIVSVVSLFLCRHEAESVDDSRCFFKEFPPLNATSSVVFGSLKASGSVALKKLI